MNFTEILNRFSIEKLNKMQEVMIESMTSDKDVVLISPTGSGKTLGYLLPILDILNSDIKAVRVLIVVPSRELAIQIEQVFKQMSSGHKINCCYGGHSVRIEENNLSDTPAILVGTPGRIGHHLRRKNLVLDEVNVLILDEFDKSLELGFKEEMEFIIQHCKSINKRVLTSATKLKIIPDFVRLGEFNELDFSNKNVEKTTNLEQKWVRVTGDDKLEALMHLLGQIRAKSVIVFCNHREAVNRISEQLKIYKWPHGIYHGGMDQPDREITMIKLRNGSVNLLITTDLASRGLDIPEIDAIIHYQLPQSEEIMIHRNGRTARMNASGAAYFILDVDDYLPQFLTSEISQYELSDSNHLPEPVLWETLYFGAGKKDKINKIDIVGMLIQKGKLSKEDIGRIDVLDHSAYVAVKRSLIKNTLKLISNEKIKNKKVKIAISK